MTISPGSPRPESNHKVSLFQRRNNSGRFNEDDIEANIGDGRVAANVAIEGQTTPSNPLPRKNKKLGTLLSRQWKTVLPFCLISYVFFQGLMRALIREDDSAATAAITSCSSHREPYSDRTYSFYFGAACCFFVSVLQQAYKIIRCFGKENMFSSVCIYGAGLTVNLIAGSSAILTVTKAYGPGGICKDMFGVETPAAQWGEWMVTVPLLAYISIAVEDKVTMATGDYAVVTLMMLSIFFGFSMNFELSQRGAICFLVLSNLALLVILVHAFSFRSGLERIGAFSNTISREKVREMKLNRIQRETRKKAMARLLLVVMPPFPFVYFLGMAGLINRDDVATGFIICSVLAKTVFVFIVSDDQVNMLEDTFTELAAEKQANDSRRAFLRYVFHEVRVPLNTISLGLSILTEDQDVVSPFSQEAVQMMTSATAFMRDTLNDVLSIHKIEEGALELVRKPFTLDELVNGACVTVRGLAAEKNISIVTAAYVQQEQPSPRGAADGLSIRIRPGKNIRRSIALGEDEFLAKPSTSLNSGGGGEGGVPAAAASSSAVAGLPLTTPQLPKVQLIGDRFRLEHVIVNFLSNAIKFSPERSKITVTVKVEYTDNNNNNGSASSAPAMLTSRSTSGTTLTATPRILGAARPQHGGAVDNIPRSSFTWRTMSTRMIPEISSSTSALGRPPPKSLERDFVVAPKRNGSFAMLESLVLGAVDHSGGRASSLISVGPPTLTCKVTVVVCDEGIGISEADAENLFIPFSQIRPDQLQQGRGSGLGLALAKEIITLHGGEVVFESTLGVGSKFGFCIPFEMSSVPPGPVDMEGKTLAGGLASKSAEGRSAAATAPVVRLHSGVDVSPVQRRSKKLASSAGDPARKAPPSASSRQETDISGGMASPMRNLLTDGRDLSSGPGVGMTSGQRSRSRRRQRSNRDGVTSNERDIDDAQHVEDRLSAATGEVDVLGPPAAMRCTSDNDGYYQGIDVEDMFGGVTPARSPGKAAANAQAAIARAPTKRFLVVDDTPSNSKMLKMILKKNDIECDIAENGLLAFEAVKAKGDSYDLIFMDFTMPIMTGDQASRKIREETNFSRLIIGLTGNALDDDVTRFIAAGVDCVISKPLRSKQLQAIIRFTETEGLHSRKPAILVTERISGPEEDYHVVEVSSHLK